MYLNLSKEENHNNCEPLLGDIWRNFYGTWACARYYRKVFLEEERIQVGLDFWFFPAFECMRSWESYVMSVEKDNRPQSNHLWLLGYLLLRSQSCMSNIVTISVKEIGLLTSTMPISSLCGMDCYEALHHTWPPNFQMTAMFTDHHLNLEEVN